jgi:hypothetical protein
MPEPGSRDCNPGPSSQSRDSGLAWTGFRDPGAQCTYRDSNPGPTFSIPGFGIETFLAGIPPGLGHLILYFGEQ